jgi:hypothetical protein
MEEKNRKKNSPKIYLLSYSKIIFLFLTFKHTEYYFILIYVVEREIIYHGYLN